MIEKSLFTERQIEIILRKRSGVGASPDVSRGAYYRQLGQSKGKLGSVYYTIGVLLALGVIEQRDIDVMLELGNRMKKLDESDIFPEREGDITTLLDMVVDKACRL
jgi:hypothetical protein